MVLHHWVAQDGEQWVCTAYDHGPFCRLCRPVDDEVLKEALARMDALEEELATLVAVYEGHTTREEWQAKRVRDRADDLLIALGKQAPTCSRSERVKIAEALLRDALSPYSFETKTPPD